MAKLYVTEYSNNGGASNYGERIGNPPVVAMQHVAIGGASAASSAFNGATHLIRVHTDAICSIVVAANPTATTDDTRMAADDTEYFNVRPGDKIAVISNT